jgi:hypothetical protein
MIKVGQVYREKRLTFWRKNNADTFVVCNAEYNISVVYNDGKTDYVGWEWIKEDCELLAEYPTWQEAVNSKEFSND